MSSASAETAGGLGAGLERRARAFVARPLFWVAIVAATSSWPVVWSLRANLPPPLPVLATLPPFQLTDQDGRPFGSKDLEGHAWVASFIFTRCTTICPAITAKMAQVQKRTGQLAPAFHLVSFSVDPAYDTPERLSAYARFHRASPRMWSFLTGPEEAVKEAVVSGLRVSMGREAGVEGPQAIFHGSHLVLVDGRGRVRSYYDSADDQAVDRVVRDAGLLVNRGG
jgi:protein SCO1/2